MDGHIMIKKIYSDHVLFVCCIYEYENIQRSGSYMQLLIPPILVKYNYRGVCNRMYTQNMNLIVEHSRTDKCNK